MEVKVRDVLVNALENLEKKAFKKFCNQLPEIDIKQNYWRIPRGKLEDKDREYVADLIREYYKDVYGVELTLEVLDKINEKKVAEELQKDLQKVNRFVRLNQVVESRCLDPKARPMTLRLIDTGEVMCSVTLDTFYPGYLRMEWKCGREKSTDVLSSQELYEERPDQTSFSVRSQVKISEDSLRSPESEVHVSWEHEYTNTRGQQTRCIRDQDFPWRPVVDDIQAPPCMYHSVPAILQCHISGYYPDAVTVKWFRKDKRTLELCEETDDASIPKIKSTKNADNTFSCTAQLMITPAVKSHQGAEYICQVEHPSLAKAIKKSIAGIKMLVRHIEGPSKLIDGEEATLYYAVDHCPEDLSVMWLIRRDGRDQEIQTSQMKGHEEESLLDTSYVIRSQREGRQYVTLMRFKPCMERHKDVTFICRCVNNQHNDEMFHCKTIYVKPRLSQPVMRSLFIPGEMKYLLNLEKFYPKSIRITWTCGVKGSKDVISSTESLADNPDGTYRVSSEVRIPEDRHKDPGFTVRVTWEHESMESPESRELSVRDSDYRWRPVVGEIQIPRLLHSVLKCDISGYFPDAITVIWQRHVGPQIYEEHDPAVNQSVTSIRAADNTYSCTVSQPITPTLVEHQGAEYICIVDHPALEKPIERSTGRLQVNDYRWRPVVGEIQIPRLVHGIPAVLQCDISMYFQEAIAVKWQRSAGCKIYEV
ncbi:uncharacterized protein [Eleutherodactylus coqui]|uniref:uncharacterized protein n=1 Tax=Eleutherodactylus coqui TaxID=57060 RepID=UPI003463421B